MILKAIPRVEEIIKIAIEQTEDTIYGSDILVLGYGIIGKMLCKKLKFLGGNIYCAARKETDLSWIREGGYIPVSYQELKKYTAQMDIIINTIPNIILKEETLCKMSKNTLIIDMASKPGGVDKNIAKLYKIRVITSLDNTEKISPRVAAKYIKRIIEREIKN